jgi:hypothetical protein
MTIPSEYVEVNKIEDFEKWVRRLEGTEWDFISIRSYVSSKYVEFRRGHGSGEGECIQFVFHGRGVADRIMINWSKYIAIEDGVVWFDKMRVRIEVEKYGGIGAADIAIKVVEFRWGWKE